MTDDKTRAKTINLFKYLSEIARLRSRPVTTTDSYQEVVFLKDIPRIPGCDSPLWDHETISEIDSWLEVKKPNLIAPPSLPASLQPLIDVDLLKQFSRIPEAPDGIFTGRGDLLSQWNQYLEFSWLPWATERERIEPHHEAYSRLHSVYQQLLRESEIYELVLGIGLLCWETPSHQRVKRHLLVIPLSVSLDQTSGKISLQSSNENGEVRLEQDMLEPLERPDAEIQTMIQEGLRELGDFAMLPPRSTEILQTWINNVSSQTLYRDTLECPSGMTTTPALHFAPAIILRKRLQYGLVRTYTEIIQQLEKGSAIPFTVRKLVEITEEQDEPIAEPDRSVFPGASEDNLLPLMSNEEQKRIVRALAERRGLLVQGPPGTGKSHTIANLICYLLATGKRILVTSQTPRALRVLKGMLPDEVKPLSVSLLGGDQESLKDLEASVQEITARQSKRRRDEETRQVNALVDRQAKLAAKESDLLRRARELREIETYEHRISFGRYNGTAQKIAERVAGERQRFDWIIDDIPSDGPSPLSNSEALELLSLLREFPLDRCLTANRPMPKLETMPSEHDFVLMVDEEQHAKQVLQSHGAQSTGVVFENLRLQSREVLTELKQALVRMLDHAKRINRLSDSWMAKAARDLCDSNDRDWFGLLENSDRVLNGLQAAAIECDECSLQLPDNVERVSALRTLIALQRHLSSGGGFGIPLFRPEPVRRASLLLRKARLNGVKLGSSEAVRQAVVRLDSEQKVDDLWGLWSQHTPRSTGSLSAQVRVITSCKQTLEQILTLKQQLVLTRSLLEKMQSVPEPDWLEISQIENLLRDIDACVASIDLEEARSRLSSIEQKLRSKLADPSTHPITEVLLRSISQRDERAFGTALASIRENLEDRKKIVRMGELELRLRSTLPALSKFLREDSSDSGWDGWLSDLENAYHWARANTWLKKFCDSHNETELSSSLSQTQHELAYAKERLVASLSWKHCLENLKEYERVHLMAWTEAMKRIGKGTGKRAPIYRAAARQHMEKCRGAIPAWIMPLYRVAETVKPGVDLFDVIIIDEASQSGPDSLFLTFLCKKLVIVGDEEQISPDDVGLELGQVDALQKQFLRDIPVPDAFGMGGSLFALGTIFFGGRISLTEHFRCMPEIIEFSNRLCYGNTPLSPLRRYTGTRLEPIQTVQILDGYQEGKASSAFNPPEARALVRTIVDCCTKPEYSGKTMGVISLLGDRQAFEIERMLLEEIGPKEIATRRIVCGNAYSFQGDERDIIFLSMVAAPTEAGMTALTAAPFRKRFNVAASRAKDQAWLFHTPTVNDFRNKECMRYRLLEYYLNPKVPSRGGRREDCPTKFQREVFDRIVARGFKAIPEYEVAGYFIDIVVEGQQTMLAVECDGDAWHTAPEDQERDMRRERILRRCGWKFWRIRGSEYYYNPEKAMEPLWELLKQIGIGPGGTDLERDGTHKPEAHKSSAQPGLHSEVRSDSRINLSSNEDNVPSRAPLLQNTFKKPTEKPVPSVPQFDFTISDSSKPKDVSHVWAPTKEVISNLVKTATLILRRLPGQRCTLEELSMLVWKDIGKAVGPLPSAEERSKLISVAMDEMVSQRLIKSFGANPRTVHLVQEEPNPIASHTLVPEPSETSDAIRAVMAHSQEAWLALSSWAKKNEHLQPWQRSLVYTIGRHYVAQGREPSVKQATQAMRAMTEAISLGFDPEHPAKRDE